MKRLRAGTARQARAALPAALFAVATCAGVLPAVTLARASTPEADTPAPVLPPDPYTILGRSFLQTPPLALAASLPPHALPGALGPLFELAATEPGAAIARLRDRRDPASKAPGAALLLTALEARLAGVDDLPAARERLRAALDGARLPVLEALAGVELARLELELGLLPEAAASARHLLRDAEERDATGFEETARLLQAEAFYLARRADEALTLYEPLASSPSDTIRAAARLRRADLDLDRGRPVPSYAALLESVAVHGVNTRPWWARAGEAALRGGDVSQAERWLAKFLEEAAADAPQAAAAGIQLADLVAARGETVEARERLDAIAARHEATAVGLLARVRVAVLDLDSGDPEVAMDQLRLAGTAAHPGIAAYANAVLGHAALERGRIDEAFRALGRASRLGPANPLPAQTAEDLRRSLAAAVSASEGATHGGCPRLVLRLAVRRAHLMEISERPEPFVRLGACYEEIGLHETAAELYREIPRRFGPSAVTQVALPLARATLAMGEFADTRTRALANAAHSDSDPEWLLLLAEASLEGQEPGPAVAVLAPRVVAGGALAGDPRALALLAQAAVSEEASPETIGLLDDALTRAFARAEGSEADALAPAALLAATLQRRAGKLGRARVFYRLAAERLPMGWRRAEASYWLVRLGDGFEAPETAAEEAGPGGAAIVRLTDHARTVRRLQSRYAISPAAAIRGGTE